MAKTIVVENASELRGALRAQNVTSATKIEVDDQKGWLMASVAGCDACVWIRKPKSAIVIGFRQNRISLNAAKKILQEELGQ